MPKFIDLAGQKFGRLTVLRRAKNHILPNGKPRTQWLCQCACGNRVIVSTQNLRSGKAMSCGCLRWEHFKKPTVSIIGNIYGKLTVISQAKTRITKTGQHKTMWNCKCECGSFVTVEGSQLKSGKTQSCGCVKSRMENSIAILLTQLRIDFCKQASFKDLETPKGSRTYFDFAIYFEGQLIALVEAQGIQHYRVDSYAPWFGSYEREITDPIKKNYCKINNIPLIEISYQDNLEYELLSALIDLHVNTVPSIVNDEGVTTISRESRD